ncbi:MAG: mycofactocin biosynthesis FMN-dependent deaminase MftD [Actinomycetota bacterium]|nr:mycofactocin biosynthesis FMN-dependent deaminase MftD [Actinomycetota bacterium]
MFETVAEAQRLAEARVPRAVYAALISGRGAGHTIRDNVEAFQAIRFAPLVADLPSKRDLGTTVMGHQLSLPVMTSPTGTHAVHPDGELAVARATAAVGTAIGLSSFATRPIEEIIAANPLTLFQLYWVGGRDAIERRLDRMHRAGVRSIILTLDWTFSSGRDWGSPSIPSKIDLKTAIQFAPQVARRPRWLLRYLRSRQLPGLAVPNLARADGSIPTFTEGYVDWMETPPPTWDDVRWVCETWPGPVMVKGVMRPDDARRSVDAGAAAVSVSNHGGNNIDGTPASIRALPAVVKAVGGDAEVLLDGGVRRGNDVVAAVALGARAVLVGRTYLYGLAAGGQAGVEGVLEVLRREIDAAVMGLGRKSVGDLRSEDISLPPAFLV